MDEELLEFQIDPKNFHTIAYNELSKSIDIDDCIPLTLELRFNDDDIVILKFITTKNDIYYYNFKAIV
jgi:hypothetical protein